MPTCLRQTVGCGQAGETSSNHADVHFYITIQRAVLDALLALIPSIVREAWHS